MMEMTPEASGLWTAIILSGVYHGVNPGMGWPLAVSSALMKKSHWAMIPALVALAFGHFLAMIAMLLPFSFVRSLIDWETQIRLVAGLLLVILGLFLFIYNKHPRFLSRIKPTQLALWSFLIAIAHGAGLMLVPFYLGLENAGHGHEGHMAMTNSLSINVGQALWVSLIHTLAMILSGTFFAVITYFWLGLKFLSTSWINLDRIWAFSLIVVGTFSVATIYIWPHH